MKEAWYRSVNLIGRTALRALGVDLRWSGIEHVPRTGPVILASTHGSYPDFVFIERAALTRGRFVRFMTRHDVWNQRLVGAAMTGMGHIPVDRQVPLAAYLRARALLRAGDAVGVFPEAGISYSYTVRSLMPGVAALARETGAPVVPLAVWGAQRIWSVGRPDEHGREPRPDLTRGRRVDVAFGPAFSVRPEENLREATEALGHRLTELLDGLQALPHHQPAPGESPPWHPAHLGGSAPSRREALDLDVVPRSAIAPTWGPGR
jgi:1-acyl-sn-glycerol-3-phosphate acyltransferase